MTYTSTQRFARKLFLFFWIALLAFPFYVIAQGAFAHKWNQIEKAILTKDFFFLYIKDEDQHIISISNKNGRNINELIAFVESNVTAITKM